MGVSSLDVGLLDRIVRALFHQYPIWVDISSAEGVDNYPFFTINELEEAILTIMMMVKKTGLLSPARSTAWAFYTFLDETIFLAA